MVVRAVTQEPPHQDARRIREVVGTSNGNQMQVLVGSIETVKPPSAGLRAACPGRKAAAVQILTPMGRHHHVRDAPVEPAKASVLDFRVHGTPAFAQTRQPSGHRHDRRDHRDHAVRPRHLAAP